MENSGDTPLDTVYPNRINKKLEFVPLSYELLEKRDASIMSLLDEKRVLICAIEEEVKAVCSLLQKRREKRETDAEKDRIAFKATLLREKSEFIQEQTEIESQFLRLQLLQQENTKLANSLSIPKEQGNSESSKFDDIQDIYEENHSFPSHVVKLSEFSPTNVTSETSTSIQHRRNDSQSTSMTHEETNNEMKGGEFNEDENHSDPHELSPVKVISTKTRPVNVPFSQCNVDKTNSQEVRKESLVSPKRSAEHKSQTNAVIPDTKLDSIHLNDLSEGGIGREDGTSDEDTSTQQIMGSKEEEVGCMEQEVSQQPYVETDSLPTTEEQETIEKTKNHKDSKADEAKRCDNELSGIDSPTSSVFVVQTERSNVVSGESAERLHDYGEGIESEVLREGTPQVYESQNSSSENNEESLPNKEKVLHNDDKVEKLHEASPIPMISTPKEENSVGQLEASSSTDADTYKGSVGTTPKEESPVGQLEASSSTDVQPSTRIVRTTPQDESPVGQLETSSSTDVQPSTRIVRNTPQDENSVGQLEASSTTNCQPPTGTADPPNEKSLNESSSKNFAPELTPSPPTFRASSLPPASPIKSPSKLSRVSLKPLRNTNNKFPPPPPLPLSTVATAANRMKKTLAERKESIDSEQRLLHEEKPRNSEGNGTLEHSSQSVESTGVADMNSPAHDLSPQRSSLKAKKLKSVTLVPPLNESVRLKSVDKEESDFDSQECSETSRQKPAGFAQLVREPAFRRRKFSRSSIYMLKGQSMRACHDMEGSAKYRALWKSALCQVIFMQKMRDQTNERYSAEIDRRHEDILVISLLCCVPMFHCLQNSDLKFLESVSSSVSFAFGSIICSKGCAAKELFIIQSGSVELEVELDHNKELIETDPDSDDQIPLNEEDSWLRDSLGPGDTLGGYDVVMGGRYKHTAVAKTSVTCIAIHSRDLQGISRHFGQGIREEKNIFETRVHAVELAEQAKNFQSFVSQYMKEVQLRIAPKVATEIVQSSVCKCSEKFLINEVLTVFSPELNVEEIFSKLMITLSKVFRSENARLYILHRDHRQLHTKVSKDQLHGVSFELKNKTIAGYILKKKRTVLIRDACSDKPTLVSFLDTKSQCTTHSVMAVPIYDFENEDLITGVAEIVNVQDSTLNGSGEYYTKYDLMMFTTAIQVFEVFVQERNIRLSDYIKENTWYIPLYTIDQPLKIEVDHLLLSTPYTKSIRLSIGLYHADTLLCPKVLTSKAKPVLHADEIRGDKYRVQFKEFVTVDISVQNIPLSSVLIIELMNSKSTMGKGPAVVLGWTRCNIFTYLHTLRQGRFHLPVELGKCVNPGSFSFLKNKMEMIEDYGSNNVNANATKSRVHELKGSDANNSRLMTDLLFVSLETYPKPVLQQIQRTKPTPSTSSTFSSTAKRLNLSEVIHNETLLGKLNAYLCNPLVEFTADEKKLIWQARSKLTCYVGLLPAFLCSVNWAKRDQVEEAYTYLDLWHTPTYIEALQLLSGRFADPRIRAFAVKCLNLLSKQRLNLILLQLVQSLRFELYMDSALSRFLICRGLADRSQCGYSLYWYFKAGAESRVGGLSENESVDGSTFDDITWMEMKKPSAWSSVPGSTSQHQLYFRLLMDQYLEFCGSYKIEILQSMYVMRKLEEIAHEVKRKSSVSDQTETLRDRLTQLILPEYFQIPLLPNFMFRAVEIEMCHVLDSKKRPLYLTLIPQRDTQRYVTTIFKAGDDLRQDQLALKILQVMEDMWKMQGLDLILLPYSCIATGEELGLIEVVPNSTTLANIIKLKQDKKHGSSKTSHSSLLRKFRNAKDALNDSTVLFNWLQEENGIETSSAPTSSVKLAVSNEKSKSKNKTNSALKSTTNESEMDDVHERDMAEGGECSTQQQHQHHELKSVVDNFTKSCAAYCVATYVLGIGDRHNDNIMLQKSGKLFHIDFGHILGNFKSKLGIKRERAAFILTPAMAAVMGGPKDPMFHHFETLACQAFQCLRRNSSHIITLLALMISCQLPELKDERDIDWVKNALFLHMTSEDVAVECFRQLIRKSLKNKATQVNDAVHLLAH